MKEKLKNKSDYILSKKIFSSLITISLILLLLFYLWFFLYSYFYEYDKLKIDNYNFNQLEQVKEKFKSLNVKYSTSKINWWEKTWMYYINWWIQYFNFYNLWDFNRKYNANITPLKNCYYFAVSSFYGWNWKYPYIFWFKLESSFYKILNFWKYYSYPWYDLNNNIKMSTWLNPDPLNKYPNNKHFEINRDEKFIQKVSNPCSELDFYDRDK